MIEEVVRQWIQKAENDLKTARDELATDEPATDTICFHGQQCAEKYLKAFLVFHQRHFRRTHDIAELIELCKEVRESFNELYEAGADQLTIYATHVRYPDDFHMPGLAETHACLQRASSVREFVLARLRDGGMDDL